ncbi:VCBS repeat-containing protein [Desulfosarcina sp. OttesenSCG-928-A07]|nr:VCBS repeat-containing protein [Desulfosarcina sp. OttesenSCG-928-G17]MDL2330275.1 VCBS repeat-containing protein [Desulfosarcina sp. OttesenSCG-928-A07]
MRTPAYHPSPFHQISRLIIVGLMVLMTATTLSASAPPARVAILPFDIHAEGDISFLREGIVDMLSSRLAWPGHVDVITKKETLAAVSSAAQADGEGRALSVGQKLGAHYVLYGSLTVFGESVSIDAKMMDVSGKREPVPFYAEARGMGEVIPQINQFAGTINTMVFNRGAAQPQMAGMPPQTGAMPYGQGTPAYDPRMHPEKLLQSGMVVEGQQAGQGYPYSQHTPNPAFIAVGPAPMADTNTDTFWKSQRLQTIITGIAMGDLDKDGLTETVVVTVNSILIFRNQGGRMSQVTELEKINTHQYVGVDVGDINGNGYPEIFVSSIGPRKDMFNSFVLEYDGSAYRRVASGLQWHFRVVPTDMAGPMLLGQKQPPTDGNLMSQPIFHMMWDGTDYVPGDVFLAGGKANVFSIAVGKIAAEENETNVIGYNEYDRITVFRPGGAIEWKSTDAHGGSLNAYQLPSKEEKTVTDSYFFPMRICTGDLDKNGRLEMIVASNKEVGNRLVRNQRFYTNSRFLSFSWSGMGMVENWKTNELSGRISDYFIGDFNNDGKKELVAALVRREGRISFSEAESIVIAYDLKDQ